MAANTSSSYYVTEACLEQSLQVVNGALVSRIRKKRNGTYLLFYGITSRPGIDWRYTPRTALTVMSPEIDPTRFIQ